MGRPPPAASAARTPSRRGARSAAAGATRPPRAGGPTISQARARAGEIVGRPERGGRVALAAVLRDLGELGVRGVLAEGGGRTIAGLLDEGLASRFALFRAPSLVGSGGGAVPLLDAPAVAEPAHGWRLLEEHWIPLGRDLLMLGRMVRGAAER